MKLKYFGPDQSVIDNLANQSIRQIFSIIIGVIALPLGFVSFFFLLSEWPLNVIVAGALILFGLLFIVTSIIMLVAAQMNRNALSRCYVNLFEDRIEAQTISDSGTSTNFSVIKWEDILAAYDTADGVRVKTKTNGEVFFKNIEAAASLRAMINERVMSGFENDTQKAPIAPVNTPEKVSFDEEKPQYCVWCGHKIPRGSTFCSECGKEQHK